MRITTKGQVTILQDIRERLGLLPHSEVEFDVVADKRRGGVRRSPLPDFYIGAHAAVSGMKLLTRNSTRYRAYFPKLRIVSP